MSKIAQKIQAIIAKAESTTNPEEADTFMKKAHALMEAEGLSLLDLGTLDDEDPLGHETGVTKLTGGGWQLELLDQLARFYGCRMTYRGYKCVTIYGRQSARITLQLMWPFVYKQVFKLSNSMESRLKYNTPKAARVRIGNSLTHRLYGLRLEREESRTEAQQKSDNALVPVDLIDQMIEGNCPNLKIARERELKTDATSRKLAEQVSLNQQTPAPEDALKLEASE